MLVAIDLARFAILLAVDLLLFLRGQLAAVGSPIVADFVVDPRFILLQMRRFPGRKLSALYALGDAVLLVLSALADFALGRGVLSSGVVLVLIDLFRELVLLLRQGLFVGRRQLPVIQAAHVALFMIEG